MKKVETVKTIIQAILPIIIIKKTIFILMFEAKKKVVIALPFDKLSYIHFLI